MQRQVKVLDCTLRDGGYYTDWDFDQKTADTYLDAVSKLPVDMIEIGYCSNPKLGYFGNYFYLTRERLSAIKSRLAPHQRLAVMLDAKDNKPEGVPALLGDLGGIVDIVRLAVAPKELGAGLALARAIKALGFDVGFNLMYLSSYADDMGKLEGLDGCKGVVASVALVDSYGGCLPQSVGSAVAKAVELLPGIDIGYHGHDNIGLAFANTLAAIDNGATIVDATFTGMGRGAGNTRTELYLVHRAAQENQPLDYDALAEVVEMFEGMKAVYGWGTNLAYMISGASSLPQKDVMDWLGKNRYSVVSILRALQKDSPGQLDEREYEPLRLNSVPISASGEVLIIGGGPSVHQHHAALARFANGSGVPVVHANFRNLDSIADFGSQQLVCLAGDGVTKLPASEALDNIRAFVTAEPPRFAGTVPTDLPGPVVQVKPYVPRGEGGHLGPVSDIGPLSLALGAALSLGATRISFAGFDGYANATSAQQELGREVQSMIDDFRKDHPEVTVQSLTPGLYDLPKASIYARLVDLQGVPAA